MASGYEVGGVDLDAIFKARVTSAGPDTGYNVGGTDLAQRYEKSGGAIDQIAGVTNIFVSGTDLKSYFQRFGYVPPPPPDTPIVINNSDPPSTATNPATTYNFTAGVNNADFRCGISAGNNVAWQWKKNGVNIPFSGTGGTAPATFQGPMYFPVAVGDAGTYTCVMTNGAGTVTGTAIMNVAP